MSETYYSIHDRFPWIYTTDTELLEATNPTEFTQKYTTNNQDVCFLSRRIIHTIEGSTSCYNCNIYSVKNPHTRESSTIYEEILGEDEYLYIHTIAVIRDGIIIDKLDTATIRVFDHETQSDSGIIYNKKKVNIVLYDVRSTDILIYEVTTIDSISEKRILEKKYFHYSYIFPNESWSYKYLDFEILNHRSLGITGKYLFLKNEAPEGESLIEIAPGESYAWKKEGYHLDEPIDGYQTRIEFTTTANWEGIVEDILALYEPLYYSDWYDRPWNQELQLEDIPIVEKIQKVIEFVQNEINYIYDAQVIEKHIPENYKNTLSQRSGDCKAKSILLKRILETIGVSCDIVLVNYDRDQLLRHYLPSPFYFNHVITRVAFSGEAYYVDPTWKDYHGNLLNRTEPFFEYCLPLNHGINELLQRNFRPRKEPSIKEEIHIKLNTERSIDIVSTYRYSNADGLRNEYRKKKEKYFVDVQTEWIMETFSFGENPPKPQDVITDATFSILEDDRSENMIKTHFHATLLRPFIDTEETVLRFYSYDIIVPTYYPEETGYFYGKYSIERTIDIEFDRPIDISDPTGVTVHNTTINTNDLFHYTNIKTFPTEKSVHVETRFESYYIGRINREQFDQLVYDVNLINDGNNGVGVALLDTIPSKNTGSGAGKNNSWISNFIKKIR